MRSVSFAYVLVAGALGIAGGLGAGAQFAATPAQAATIHMAPAADTSSPATADWVARLDSLNWANAVQEVWLPDIQAAIHDDAELRSAVLKRYLGAATPDVKSGLRLALTGNPVGELSEVALALAQGAERDKQSAGWYLLADLPPTQSAYDLAKKTLLSPERDAEILEGVVRTLRHPVLMPPQDRQAVIPRLISLTHAEAPMVRAHSLQTLAGLDADGRKALPEVLRGLSDSDVSVRQAAVGAVMVGQLKSDKLKHALLGVLRNPGEDLTARAATLMALEHFDLTESEYRDYRTAWDDIDKLGNSNPAAG